MKHYTYIHSTPSGQVFYVGKGVDERMYSRSDRSIAWKQTANKEGGILVLRASMWNTEEEAFEHEKFLIACFKDMGCKLVNATSGGKGPNDYCTTEESRKNKSLQMTGYKHKTVTCSNCGEVGGETSMKRWHFEKCTGKKGKEKARVTVDGKRIFLGYFHTKDEATKAMADYYKSAGKPLPKEFLRYRKVVL